MQKTRIIHCESPDEYIWNEYLFLENEITGLSFLKEKYTYLGIPHPEQVAFKNVQAFNDYIKQARAIFTTLNNNSLWVQPLLLYYGMMALLKAFILTQDPDYPANTSVLQHGLSTRRRKKAHFRFGQDEIRIQREGLFPHVASLVHPSQLQRDSFKAEALLSCIPEMQDTYTRFFHTPSLVSITLDTTPGTDGARLSLPEFILDHLHIPASSLVEKLNREGSESLFQIDPTQSPTKSHFHLIWKHANNARHPMNHPWIYENTKGDFYLWIGKNRYDSPVSELLSHHMLLFALGMICRYETSLWGEIVSSSTSEESILIQQLLPVVKRKFPHMVLHLLRDERLILLIK